MQPLEKRKSSDEYPEQDNKDLPLKKRPRYIFSEPNPSSHMPEVIPDDHPSTGDQFTDAFLATAVRRHLEQSLDHTNQDPSTEQQQDRMKGLSDQASASGEQPEISWEERKNFRIWQQNPDLQEGLIDLPENILAIAERLKMEADEAGSECLGRVPNRTSYFFYYRSQDCGDCRKAYNNAQNEFNKQPNQSNANKLASTLTKYEQAVVDLSQFTIQHLKVPGENTETDLDKFVKQMEITSILDQQYKLQKLERYKNFFQNIQIKYLKGEVETTLLHKDIATILEIIAQEFPEETSKAEEQRRNLDKSLKECQKNIGEYKCNKIFYQQFTNDMRKAREIKRESNRLTGEADSMMREADNMMREVREIKRDADSMMQEVREIKRDAAHKRKEAHKIFQDYKSILQNYNIRRGKGESTNDSIIKREKIENERYRPSFADMKNSASKIVQRGEKFIQTIIENYRETLQ